MNDIERIEIYETMPKGWKVLEGATTAPKGYVWIWNVKSLFPKNGEERFRSGLIKEDNIQKHSRRYENDSKRNA